jgi:hypothetical protein
MSTETISTEQQPEGTQPAGGDPEGQTFTQADVNRIVKERAERIAKQLYPDYDDLKAKAGESRTLEQRIAEMESRTQKAEAEALRARVAAEFGISTKKGPKGEPSDADLFLTGADVDTLTAQAERLAVREVDRKKQGNFAPKEGTNTTIGGDDEDLRGFARKLFNKE